MFHSKLLVSRWAQFLLASCLVIGLCAVDSFGVIIFANDNADNATYTSDEWQLTDNGGFGYLPWIESNNSGGAGFFREHFGRQIEGGNSFSIFSSAGSEALVRPLAQPIANGEYTVLGRHDVDNGNNFTGFNIKSTSAGALSNGELLSFGMAPSSGNNSVSVFGLTTQTINLGHELRGNILSYDLKFDTIAQTFSLSVTDLSNPATGSVSGLLKFPSSQMAALGFGNFNSGGGQNFVFDIPTVLPEPTSIGLLAGAMLMTLNRRRRA